MKILVVEGLSSFCEASPTKVLWRDALAGCSVLKYGCGLVLWRDALAGCSDGALHERAWRGQL